MKNSRVSAISDAAKSDESGVEAPAWSFTAVRENPPVVGYDWKNDPIIFDIPKALNSWFGSIVYPCFSESAFETENASINATKAKVKAIGISFTKFPV